MYVLQMVGSRDDVRMLGMRQLGNRRTGGDLHLVVDRGRAHIQCATEDEREAERVVYLIGKIGSAGRHDHIVAHRLGYIGQDFRGRIGQRQNQRRARHLRDHLRLEHAASGQAEENVGITDDIAQGTSARLACEGFERVVHIRPAGVEHALNIGHPDMLKRQAHLEQQGKTGQGRCTGAGGHQLNARDVLTDHLEAIENRSADNDGGAVLVVMEDRNLHALAQLLLDVEALRRLNVFEVNAAEGRLQRGDGVDQLVWIILRELEVEHIDAGELLEQYRLAFHHRLGGEWANIAEAEYSGTVGHHSHHIGAPGQAAGLLRIIGDRHTGRSHTGRVGQGKFVLIGEALGGHHGDFAGAGECVVLECCCADVLIHVSVLQ